MSCHSKVLGHGFSASWLRRKPKSRSRRIMLIRGGPGARLRAEGKGLRTHGVQLAGCEPHWMREAARIAEASGAAVIDINMGCPARQVTGGQSGSALMRDLDHALTLIEATVGAV